MPVSTTATLTPVPARKECHSCHTTAKEGDTIGYFALERWATNEVGQIKSGLRNAIIGSLVVVGLASLFAVPIEMLGPRRAGISSGFSNFFANLGGFASTWGIGAAKDATGSFAGGFIALATACVAGIALTAYLPRQTEAFAWPPIALLTRAEVLTARAALKQVTMDPAMPGAVVQVALTEQVQVTQVVVVQVAIV